MKPKLLYLYPNKATFVQKDIAFLSDKYDVQTQDLSWTDKISLPINFIKQFFFLISRTNKADAIIVMFGGYWSFLPALIGKLFSKRVFVILGGTDCVSFPEFNYGSLRKQPLKWFIKKSYQWSTRLLPVDDSLMSTDYKFRLNAIHKKQGVMAHFPNLKTAYTVIPNGFDTDFWESNNDKIPLSFLSVAFVNDATRLTLKGFDTVIKLANHFKDTTFTLVGLSHEFALQLQLPKNIKVYDYLSVEDLKKEIVKHRFYLQLSLSEGFPNSLGEAMLGHCIPIVTDVGGMSKIVGNTGFVLAQKNETILIEAINKLLALPQSKLDKLGCDAKNRIASNFSIEKRAALFESILSEV